MNIKKNVIEKINVPIAAVVLSGAVLDNKENFAVALFIVLIVMIMRKGKLKLIFPAKKEYLILLVLGVSIGTINCFFSKGSTYVLFKHIYYFLMPFIYWVIGSKCQDYNERKANNCLYTIAALSFIFAIYDILTTVFKLIRVGEIGSVNLFREVIGLSGGITIYGFCVLLYFKNELNIKKQYGNIMIATMLISLLMHFSRTSIVQMAIYFLFLMPFLKLKKRIRYISLILMSIIIIIALSPELFNSFLNKILNSLTEISFTYSNWNEYSINNNWRGYEAYCAINNFENSNILIQIFGNGFGFELDPGGYASLVTSEDGLIFLHNGYFTNLMLWGVLGFFLYFVFIIKSFKYSNSYKSEKEIYFFRATIVMFAVCTYFANGPLFGVWIAEFYLILGILSSRCKLLYGMKK